MNAASGVHSYMLTAFHSPGRPSNPDDAWNAVTTYLCAHQTIFLEM